MDNWRARFRAAARQWDQPLRSYQVNVRDAANVETMHAKSVLLFDALRKELGDEAFLKLMTSFHADHSTQRVTSAQFIAATEKAAGRSLQPFFDKWLGESGLPGDAGSPTYLLTHWYGKFSDAVIVYGTHGEAGANRYAAEKLQAHFLDYYESEAPIRKDYEVSDEELKNRNVLFVGRPETNQALAAWAGSLGLIYDAASFTVEGVTHPGQYEALAAAYVNPLNPGKMVLVLAGNSALETVRLADYELGKGAVQVLKDGKPLASN